MPKPLICPQCGAPLAPDALSCNYCHIQFSPEVTPIFSSEPTLVELLSSSASDPNVVNTSQPGGLVTELDEFFASLAGPLPSPTTPGQIPEGWEVYRDAWAGFTLSKPRGWKVSCKQGAISVRKDPAGLTSANLQSIHLQAPMPIQQIAQIWLSQAQIMLPGCQGWIVNTTPPNPNRLTLRIEAHPMNTPVVGSYCVILNGNNALISGFHGPKQNINQDASVLQTILSTFKGIERMPSQMMRERADDAGALLVPTGWQAKMYVQRGTADGNAHVMYDVHREKESLAQAALTWWWWTFCDGKMPFLGYITPVTSLAYKPAAAVCQTFFSEWLHTKFKKDLKIEAIDDNPEYIPYMKADTARSGFDPNKVDVSSAWMTFSYNEKGRRFRERSRFCVSHANDQKASIFTGPPLWYGYADVYYRAPVEEFDALEPILAGIIDSYKENPAWFPKMQQEQALAVAAIQADIHNRQVDIGNRLNQISNTLSQTSDIVANSYWSNQATYDNISQQRSNAMLGYQDVADTSGAVYNVPNNYEQYWTDGLNNIYAGDWQVTPDPSWTRLTPTGQ